MLFMLTNITITPTATMIAFDDMRLDILAAIGDATALPITSPATASQCLPLSIVIKVIELINAIKNLDNLTVPREKRGCLPPAIRVDSTIEPQPPPPTASIKPPPKPSKPIFLIFSDDLITTLLKALLSITTPKYKRINRYKRLGKLTVMF